MTESNTFVPELKLSTAPAAPEAPSADEAITSIQETATTLTPAKEEETAMPMLDDSQLNEAERKAIDTFISKLDINNPDHVLLFGADAQKKVSSFSDSALAAVKTQETGEVGTMLVDLVQQLKTFPNLLELV